MLKMHMIYGAKGSGGGALGAILATPLVNLLGKIGATILCIGVVLMFAVFTFGINMSEIINNIVEKSEENREERIERKQKLKEEQLKARQEVIENRKKEKNQKELMKTDANLKFSVSVTTRAPREGEKDGVDYYFKTEEEFKRLINSKGLLEYTVYNGCYYGTPVEGVNKAINEGKICFLIIEVEGGQNIMKLMPECVPVFLPPSLEVLEERLIKRHTDSMEDIKHRIELAKTELSLADVYKYNVVNDDLEKAVDKIEEILEKELLAHNR